MSYFRHTTPVPPGEATGLVAEVYAQQARDFGGRPLPLFMALSPAPDVLAAVWSLLRESLLTGPGDPVGKELVAHGVSVANGCAYCIDAHTVLLHANGAGDVAEALVKGRPLSAEHETLHQWGRAPEGCPFPGEDAAGYGGTALGFHVVNRLVSSTMNEQFLPGGIQRFATVRKAGGRAFARTIARRGGPGESHRFLPEGDGPAWAGAAGRAIAALRAIAREGAEHPRGAILAGKAATDPHSITADDVAALDDDEATLLRVLTAGAMTAVDRVEARIAATLTEAGGPPRR